MANDKVELWESGEIDYFEDELVREKEKLRMTVRFLG